MATYPIEPDKINNIPSKLAVRIVKFERGREQRAALAPRALKEFSLNHYALTRAQADVLHEFYSARLGSVLPFYFQNFYDGKTYTVRFDEGGITETPRDDSYFDITVRLIECYS